MSMQSFSSNDSGVGSVSSPEQRRLSDSSLDCAKRKTSRNETLHEDEDVPPLTHDPNFLCNPVYRSSLKIVIK